MNEQYLWDRTGEADPELARIEELLGAFKYDRPAKVDLPIRRPAEWRMTLPPLAVAASIALLCWVTWPAGQPAQDGASPGPELVKTSGPSWKVLSDAGTPKIGSTTVGAGGRLSIGQWLTTDASSKATLMVADIGRVKIAPNSRVLLKSTQAAGPSNKPEHRIELARGRIEAYISAPPRLFFVETPSATAVDLGCMYNLEVDGAGAGVLEVTYGAVELEWDGRRSFVPAEARCRTRPGVGPGTPYFPGLSDKLMAALEQFDFGNGGTSSVERVLSEASLPRDTLALWHLLSRVDTEMRSRVFDRIAALTTLPNAIARDAVLDLDRDAVDALKAALLPRW